MDKRPICNCNSYNFPHKIGGRCSGSDYTEFYYYNIRELCDTCNSNNDNVSCDVATGLENIKHADCYQEFCCLQSGEHLPLKLEDIIDDERS